MTSGRDRRALRGAALLCSALLALGATAEAQQSAEREALSADLEVLEQRDRRELHPDPEPLKLRGMDVDALRERTPALAGPERSAAVLGEDEAYARRLALYDSRARFDSPARSTGSSASRSGAEPQRGTRRSAAPTEPEPADPGWPVWPWFLAAAAAGGYVYIRVQAGGR